MMYPINFILPLLLLCLAATASAQEAGHVPGELLVRLSNQGKPADLIVQLGAALPQTKPQWKNRVSKSLNVWLLEVVPGDAQEHAALEWLNRRREVLAVQYNHILEYRGAANNGVPNDPLYYLQWHHKNSGASGGTPGSDFDSEPAWNIATGGLTPLGDTIVVAVIDGGLEQTHEDLIENMWFNHLEIPNDGLDNDGNGYVDDFRGWNIFAANDNLAGIGTSHGTPVSALVGAKGNNNTGVAGINWDVKIMFVAGNSQESVILAAYDYVLLARKRYNATNGQQGAFVVAVNCSWGITGGQPSSAPLWCAAFDSLGAAGILSVAATANASLDVDVEGDLPTACPSDYMLAVTSLTRSDQKADNAAWGATTIDLGAYGKDIFTARAGNTYGTFSGTSYAAPQVSGAVGLLYSAPCNNLAAMSRANPAAAALWVKAQILGAATPNSSLQNRTVTGGRLNLYNLMQGYEDQCADCFPPFALAVGAVSENSIAVHWSVVDSVQSVNLRWRKKGDPIWTLAPGATSPYTLTGLQTCAEYEVSLRANCGGNGLSIWTEPVVFGTDGCCSAPAGINVVSIGNTMAQLAWNGPGAAISYRVRLQLPSGDWLEFQAGSNNITLLELIPCTVYTVEVVSLCASDTTSQTSSFQFLTSGCGACTDLVYCNAGATSAKDEWISKVEIGNWSHSSGGNVGYKNFTGIAGNVLELLPDVNLPITLTPAFSGFPYKEYFRIYVDYNADGDFNDPGELAFDPGFSSEMPISGEIIPPATIASGLTRMRVLMKYRGLQGAPPTPCETFEFGQVADYCVHLGPMVQAFQRKKQDRELLVYPLPARHWVSVHLPSGLGSGAELTLLDATGRQVWNRILAVNESPITLDVSGLQQGFYLIRLQDQTDTLQQKIIIARP
jgi:subtilisin family serine protease